MKILSAVTATNEGNSVYRFSVWLDETKTQANGTPDPQWVQEIDYSTIYPEGINNDTDYMNWIQTELAAWASATVQAINYPPASPAETLVN